MNILNIIIAICSLLLVSIGFDKFLFFIDPPCSLAHTISPIIWKGLGVLQIAGGILIWFPKFRKPVTGFFILFMLFFTVYHITQHTYDVGGAIFIAVLLAIVFWNPSFLRGKNNNPS